MRLSLLPLLCLWIEIENVSSVDYLTQANKDQLLLGFCYFLCCVFNVCKLGHASKTIETVYNTHCYFDGYFYRKKCVLYTGKYGNPMQEGRGERGVNDHPIRQGSKQK